MMSHPHTPTLDRSKHAPSPADHATQRRRPRALLLALLALLAVVLGASCTIIRPDEGGGSGNGNGGGGGGGIGLGGAGGGGGSEDEPEPVEVDMLVLVALDNDPVSQRYDGIIGAFIAELALVGVNTHKVGVVPMYRRVNDEVPLIYGEGEAQGEFGSYGEAIREFTSRAGLALLEDTGALDGDNLIDIGGRLGTTSVLHPSDPTSDGTYYYEGPRDGMIVVWLNPYKRRCGLAGCDLPSGNLGDLLTARTAEGEAAWLLMGGNGRLPAERVFHLFIGTEETSAEESFFSGCESQVGFPAELLDYIEPSPSELYAQLQSALGDAGIPNDEIDFCDALSIQLPLSLAVVTGRVYSAMRR